MKRAMIAVALILVMVGNAAEAYDYINDFEDGSQENVFVYDKFGRMTNAVFLTENYNKIMTDIIYLEDNIKIIEFDIFLQIPPTELSTVLKLCSKQQDYNLLLINEDGFYIFNGDDYIKAAQNFILDWYTVRLVIYNGKTVQLFVNNIEVIPEIDIIFTKECIFSFLLSDAKALIDNIRVYSGKNCEIEKIYFYKNGCPTFSLKGKTDFTGFTVYNFSENSIFVNAFLSEMVGNKLLDSSLTALEVPPQTCVSSKVAIGNNFNVDKVKLFIWDKNLKPYVKNGEAARQN